MSKPTPDDAVDFYSEIATQFDATYTYDPNRLDRLKVWDAYLARYAGNANLAYDLGCGSGAITGVLSAYTKRVIAIDGARGMLEVAQAQALKRGLSDRIEFRQCHLPISNPVGLPLADLVISSSAIEYMESIPEALAFANKLLHRDGTLIFSMSNRDSIARAIVRTIHRITGKPKYIRHLRHFVTVATLKVHLRNAGFDPLEDDYFGGADHLNRALKTFLAPQYTSNMIIIAARRIR